MSDETITETLSLIDEERPLPEGWRSVSISNVCDLVGKTINPQSYSKETFAHYSIPAFDENQQPTIETGGKILSNKILFDKDVVLFSKLNPRISRVWHVNDDHKFRRICSTEFIPLKPRSQVINANYLVFVLQEPETISLLRSRVMAATKSRERLSPSIVLTQKIPLPPTIEEQRRIASVIDEQVKAIEQVHLAVKEQLAAANLMPHAFLRSVFESEEAQNWQKTKLGELCEVVRGSSPRPQGDKRYYGGKVPRLMVADLTRDGMFVTPKIDFLTEEGAKLSRPMRKGEVVIAVSGNPGLPAILAVDACIHDGFVGLRHLDTDRVNTRYLYHLLFISKDDQSANATGAIFRNLTTDQVRAIEIPLPSTIEQQEKVVEKLNEQMQAVKTLKKSLTDKLEAINKLPAALLRNAFAGEI